MGSFEKVPSRVKRWVQWLTSRHNVLVMFCIYNILLVPVAMRELSGISFGVLAALNLSFAALFLKEFSTKLLAMNCVCLFVVVAAVSGQVTQQFLTVTMLGSVSGSFLLTLYHWLVPQSSPLQAATTVAKEY